jgi:hypothetical protein
VPEKTLLGNAIGYARNRRVQLARFLEDGRIPLDNGEPERLNRRIALIRKNSLFIGSDEGAERGAVADVEVQFVESPIMNQLSYEVSNRRIKKRGFQFTGNLEKNIGDTITLLRAAGGNRGK